MAVDSIYRCDTFKRVDDSRIKYVKVASELSSTSDNPYNLKEEETKDLKKEKVSDMEKVATNSTDRRPFTCNICAHGFKAPSYLKKHLLNHKQKSYKCKTCTKVFKNFHEVKLHEQNHTNDGDTSYTCSVCNDRFGNGKHSYYKHIIQCVERKRTDKLSRILT